MNQWATEERAIIRAMRSLRKAGRLSIEGTDLICQITGLSRETAQVVIDGLAWRSQLPDHWSLNCKVMKWYIPDRLGSSRWDLLWRTAKRLSIPVIIEILRQAIPHIIGRIFVSRTSAAA